MRIAKSRGGAGFTLIELLVVIAIILIVAAMAIPGIMGAADSVRLRSTASNLSGLMQSARQMAIKDNRFYTCRAAAVGGANLAFIDSLPAGAIFAGGSGNGAYDAATPGGATLAIQQGEKVVQIPDTIQFETGGANPPFAAALIGVAPQAPTVMPTFNERGLPCQVNAAGRCVTTSPVTGGPVAFLYFLRMDGSSGRKWAAVSVTPAGRVRVWLWSGRVWS